MPQFDLTELQELHKKATQAPWGAVLDDDPKGRPSTAHMGVVAIISYDPAAGHYHSVMAGCPSIPNQWPENTKLIAAMRNALPHLMDELKTLRVDAAELQKYIDDAKAACGDHRVTGQPLDHAISVMARKIAELRETFRQHGIDPEEE